MFGFERNQHLTIGTGNHRWIAERKIDSAHGHADVVDDRFELVSRDDPPNPILDRCEEALGLFDPRRRRSPDVELHLSGVDGGKKIAPQEGNQGDRTQRRQYKHSDEYIAMSEGPLQSTAVAVAQPLEASLNPAVCPGNRISTAGPLMLFAA